MANAPVEGEEFFDGFPEGRAVYRRVARCAQALDGVTTRVTGSQVAFRRRRNFAYVWRPGRHLRSTVPAVLSFALPYALASPRLKEVAHPAPRVWMHHVELNAPGEVDPEAEEWIRRAWEEAG